jgi:DNA-binding beta-propeller fold protein YncE
MTMRTQAAPPVLFAGLLLLLVAPLAAGPSLPAPLRVSGFATPESVLYDPVGDVYLVSNINGNPTGADDNGFISRVRPDGTVAAARWIDGAAAAVTLNAPKGLAISGDTLFVADITAVRLFDRRTGAPKGAVVIPGSTFVNDLAAGPDGSVYVTDSGLRPDFSPSGTDAVYRLRRGRLSTVARGTSLGRPNGVAVLPNGRLVVVTFSPTGEIYQITPQGARQQIRRLPQGQLDGVVVLPGQVLLVSSWAASAVYRVTGARAEVLVSNVPAPADIGYDSRRNRVLIPLFQQNQVVIQPLR